MTTNSLPTDLTLLDFEPSLDDFTTEVLAGLRRWPRELPCKFFYDQRGSQLFDQICELDEYYLTRTEMAIMRAHVPAMARCIGPEALLVELGSGSSLKTRILLDHLPDLAGYVPLDISRQHLMRSARRLRQAYPRLEILPTCADYLQAYDLPTPRRAPRRTVLYFPGSTIGNFEYDQAHAFLGKLAELAGPGGGLLIGADLRKSPDVLVPAYDDAQGVTAEFNLNLLHRINREAGGTFDLLNFEHHAVWNDALSRIEMHLVSRRRQAVRVADQTFHFKVGEAIRTECSHKYTLDGFAALADAFEVRQVLTDPQGLFSVQYLTVRA